MDCTAIPQDEGSLSSSPLPGDVFRTVLGCIQICADPPAHLTLHPLENPDTFYGRDPASVKPPHEVLYEGIAAAPAGTECFQVDGASNFVCGLQALMLCSQRGRTVPCLYVVDPNFSHPEQWSYRYFWRYQARETGCGLSVVDVGILARQAAQVCDVAV